MEHHGTFIYRCAAEIPENDRNSFHGAYLPQLRIFFLAMEIPAEITLRQKFLPPDFVGMLTVPHKIQRDAKTSL